MNLRLSMVGGLPAQTHMRTGILCSVLTRWMHAIHADHRWLWPTPLSLCTRVTRTTTATLLHQPESAVARPINYKPFLFMNYSNQASFDPSSNACRLVPVALLPWELWHTHTRTLASSACPFVGELLCTGTSMLQRWIKASTNYDSCRQRYKVLARVQNKP
jgi:hypothetical protein